MSFPGVDARTEEIALTSELRAVLAYYDELARERQRTMLEDVFKMLMKAPRAVWRSIALDGVARDVSVEFPAQVVYVVNNSTASVTVQAPGDPVPSPSITANSTGLWLCPGATQVTVNGTGTGLVALRFLNEPAARLQWLA